MKKPHGCFGISAVCIVRHSFSKIKAGKAVVTREWLLRFCIALQPSLESIEKLLAKAQMEPLASHRRRSSSR